MDLCLLVLIKVDCLCYVVPQLIWGRRARLGVFFQLKVLEGANLLGMTGSKIAEEGDQLLNDAFYALAGWTSIVTICFHKTDCQPARGKVFYGIQDLCTTGHEQIKHLQRHAMI